MNSIGEDQLDDFGQYSRRLAAVKGDGGSRHGISVWIQMEGEGEHLTWPSFADVVFLQFQTEVFLLKSVEPRDAHKKCLVIDLDETLVHSSFQVIFFLYISKFLRIYHWRYLTDAAAVVVFGTSNV